MGPEKRLRTSFHFGFPKELLFDLKACGMLEHRLPTELGGSLDMDQFLGRVNERFEFETKALATTLHEEDVEKAE